MAITSPSAYGKAWFSAAPLGLMSGSLSSRQSSPARRYAAIAAPARAASWSPAAPASTSQSTWSSSSGYSRAATARAERSKVAALSR
ncbi:hypothetical protein SMICM304S_08391 [Streptomyces microflavus]